MNKLFYTCWLLLPALGCFSQPSPRNEFAVNKNGLIYGDTTIRQLKFIVDSLNLKFKVCELNRVYLTVPQGKAHYISLEKGAAKSALEDLKNNMPFNDFIKKYPSCAVQKDLLVIKSRYEEDGKQVTDFNSFKVGDDNDYELTFTGDAAQYDGPLQGKWVYTFHPKDEYSEQSVEAFYFVTDLEQSPLPEKYARMVQYTDCMIDTTTSIYRLRTKWDRGWSDSLLPKMAAFQQYLIREAGEAPPYDDKNPDAYYAKYEQWETRKAALIENTLSKTATFKTLLTAAADEAMQQGGSGDEFEDYVEAYYSKKVSLELKRGRRVIGGCSQDQSPRIHALNIAKLSAETVSWETFLRAHLDIMNDRFDRMSDGSYAWKERKTYIKELEVLDINLPDLMMGISLRISNPSTNHYYGSIGRLGRALSETAIPAVMETKMLEMIADSSLDTYNRLIIYYLFLNYTYNLENKEKRKANIEQLNATVKALPAFLADKAVVKPKAEK